MPGPPKKPANLKLISGTQRADREESPHVELPLLDGIPEPVEWLPNAHAVKEWRRLAPTLVNNKLLAEADLSTFGHMCALHGALVQSWSVGVTPTGRLLMQYSALASAFGLSAAWRSKVKPEAVTAKTNRFAKYKTTPGISHE